MNYKRQYDNLIESIKILNRNKKNGFYENHHINPKCFGGSNKKDNLILLTPREHYIAHLLLTQMYDGKAKGKMCYAFMQMCRCNQNQNRMRSSNQYELAKKLMAKNCSGENASFYGKKLSDKTKKILRDRMTGKNNPLYGKDPWNKGKKLPPHSTETKKKLSIANLGKKRSEETKLKISIGLKGKPKSKEHRRKLSEVNMGKKLSIETRRRQSLVRKGVPHRIITCPYCNTSGGIPAMKRWHLDNCKLK